ncbi:MAG: DUF3277 domain-containing protein [Deltaproteobacteria bacterium]|nr:DUF3277 domain-containing protein [Deltaproteobacteria bacterium]
MTVANYDPQDVMLVFGGRTITGFSDGTYITAEKTDPKWTTHVGAQGEVVRARNRSPIGTITFTLKRTSPDLDYLIDLMNSNEVKECYLIDRNDKQVTAGGREAWIAEFPSFGATAGTDIPDIEFKVEIADFELRSA